jgi:hypothetical protein
MALQSLAEAAEAIPELKELIGQPVSALAHGAAQVKAFGIDTLRLAL